MNAFTTLGLAETATPAEVKKAYRARLLQVHPDLVGEAGRQPTIEVIAAYEQAMRVARANAAAAEETGPIQGGFVPAHSPAHGARIRKDQFVATTFSAVA